MECAREPNAHKNAALPFRDSHGNTLMVSLQLLLHVHLSLTRLYLYKPWPLIISTVDWFTRTQWEIGWVLHINTFHFFVISIQTHCLWLPLIPFPGCQTALLDYLSLHWWKFLSLDDFVPAIFCIRTSCSRRRGWMENKCMSIVLFKGHFSSEWQSSTARVFSAWIRANKCATENSTFRMTRFDTHLPVSLNVFFFLLFFLIIY